MARRNPTLRRIGFIIFLIAIVLGFILILVRAEPDLESTLYGFIKFNYPRLTSLTCPVLMTTLDRELVTVKLHNPLDRVLTWHVQAQFSPNIVLTETSERVDLQPGESRLLSWEVGQENVDLGYFIFARVFASSSSTLPMRESTCGTLVLDLQFNGGPTIFYAVLILSAFGLALGLILWFRFADPSDSGIMSHTWWMRFIALVIVIGVIAAIFNSWFFALLMAFLALLLMGVILMPRKE